MFKNYLKTTFRNLWKNKTFSLINIAGLSIGMAACLLILQYASFQLSFDRFNKHAADIYRVTNDRFQNGKLIQHGTIMYSAIGKALQDDYPEVINHMRAQPWGKTILQYKDKKIGDQQVIAVDNSFLSMFSYPMLAGDAKTALEQPYSAVLTTDAAQRLYGTGNGDWSSFIGKTFLRGTDSMPLKVTGIIDLPENSHLQFDCFASYSTMLAGKYPYKEADYDFKHSDFWHYIQLRPGTDYKALEAKLPAFSDRHFQGTKVSGSVEKFYLQPLLRAHLYSDYEYDIGKTASATVVWGLLAIAVLIVVIAWVNYINLATAKSLERAKEVGVRKVSGATRGQLVRQFLTESLVLNLAALVIALILVLLAQRGLNALVQHKLSLAYLFQKGWNGYGISVALIVVILAGIIASGFYPAFVLSSFKPIDVLKGRFTGTGRGAWLRKSLVTGQFAITVVLIIGSFIVYRQIKYVNEQDLGMNISQMLIIKPPQLTHWDSSFISQENSFAAEVEKLGHVKGVATSNRVAGEELGRSFNIRRIEAPETEHYTTRFMGVSKEYLDLYDIKLLAGRGFVATDYNPKWERLHNIIINASAARLLGFATPAAAVGRTILSGTKPWDIVGVIADVHQKSLRYAIEPTLYQPVYGTYNPISVKVDTRNLGTTMADIRQKYETFFPGNLFDYYFIDERFNSLYANDLLFGRVFGLFSGLAILIACLGLFGLSLFATLQRTKEIGVRKVLGASLSSIVVLLSKDFVRLVLLANLLGFPLAWWIMNNWLKDFAYRISISWWVFAGAGLLALLIALITVSVHAFRDAVANPAKSLRTE
ncbi:MAG: ABC transporter permease [Bacteroidota bacterium]|nr:ABC transporter permease [Bacteroidota bacterium]